MQKIKISDCITQDQPQLVKTVFNSDGQEIATLKSLNMREKNEAIYYAIDKKKAQNAKNPEDAIKDINVTDHLLKSIELAIVEWCFDVPATVENMLKISAMPEYAQVINDIVNGYNKTLEDWNSSQKAIEKN